MAKHYGYFCPETGHLVEVSTITGGSLIQPISSISGVTPSTDEITVRVGTSSYLLNTATWTLVSASGTLGADIPYTELAPDILETNVGDVLYGLYSSNMFDKNAVKTGYYLDSTGAEVANTSWNISDYMPVEGGETYYQTINTPGQSPRICWYDSNKTFISAVEQRKGTQTAPSNAAFCRMCVWTTDIDIAMFTHGTTAPTSYEPYHFGLHPSGEQTVTVGDQTRTITTFLPSVTSFIDAQKASNNAECDWAFKVLDGTNFQFTNIEISQGKYWFYNIGFKIDYVTEADFGIVLSDHFVGGRKNIDEITMSRSGVGYFQVLGVGMGGATTVAEANAWIKEHHPIIAYPLATPEVTTVTLSEFTQPLGTVTILNEFADGTKGAVNIVIPGKDVYYFPKKNDQFYTIKREVTNNG